MVQLLLMLQAHVVSAFEQSLANMTHRLQQLAANTDQKVGSLRFSADDTGNLRNRRFLIPDFHNPCVPMGSAYWKAENKRP